MNYDDNEENVPLAQLCSQYINVKLDVRTSPKFPETNFANDGSDHDSDSKWVFQEDFDAEVIEKVRVKGLVYLQQIMKLFQGCRICLSKTNMFIVQTTLYSLCKLQLFFE